MAINKEPARVYDGSGVCKISTLRLCTFFQHDQQKAENLVNSLTVNKQAPNKRAMNFGQFVEASTANRVVEIQKIRFGAVSRCQLVCHVKN